MKKKQILKNFALFKSGLINNSSLDIQLISIDDNYSQWKENYLSRTTLGNQNEPLFDIKYFETCFYKTNIRHRHHLEAIEQARRTQKSILKETFGTWELFIPIPEENSKPVSFFYIGRFLQEFPRCSDIKKYWNALSGQETGTSNEYFKKFTKVFLDIPILSNQIIKLIEDFFLLIINLLNKPENEHPSIIEKLSYIEQDFFSKQWPSFDAGKILLDSQKSRMNIWPLEQKLQNKIKSYLEVSKLPTTVMLLMLKHPSSQTDETQVLINNRFFQKKCIDFAKSIPDTYASAFCDYGVSVLTSCKTNNNKSKAIFFLEKTAQKILNFSKENFNQECLIGVGSSVTSGYCLFHSQKEALQALNACAFENKTLLFFNKKAQSIQTNFVQVQSALNNLETGLLSNNSNNIKISIRHYHDVLLSTVGYNLEKIRAHLESTLFQLFCKSLKHNPIPEEARNSFFEKIIRPLNSDSELSYIFNSFEEALLQINSTCAKPWRGPNGVLIETAKQYMHENFDKPLSLKIVSQKAGFSIPIFTRVFKENTGVAFVSYLTNIRIEHIKKLLCTTSFSLGQISQACGFNSQHHMLRTFKKITLLTPGEYRKKNCNN
jgi:AraC-like DNA-binding protein